MPSSGDRPLVSVITPTYNNERFLVECIDSVLAQTYSRWEYLVVDDASTDDTVAIALRYAEKDDRIVVHRHSQRLGVPANWNRSLGYMSSESAYCKFVHADDWLFPECLEKMVGIAEANPSVGAVGAYRIDGRRVNLDGLPADRTVFPGEEILRATLLDGLYVFGSPTSLLLRSELVRRRDALYDESTLHADSEACFDLLSESDFGFVHQVLTFTRRHEGAVTGYASWLGTYRPSQIAMHRRYGHTYLSRDEYERRLAILVFDYSRFVLKRLPRLRDERFRDYHGRVLRDLGTGVGPGELVRGAALQLRRGVGRRRRSSG